MKKEVKTSVDVEDFYKQVETGLELFAPIIQERGDTVALLQGSLEGKGRDSHMCCIGEVTDTCVMVALFLQAMYKDYFEPAGFPFKDFVNYLFFEKLPEYEAERRN